MTYEEILDKFKDNFSFAKVDDYRPICHELFTDDKEGITIWLDNGDILEYYPKVSNTVDYLVKNVEVEECDEKL